MGFPSLENSYDVAVLISFDFPSNSKGDDLFDFIDYDYFHADQSWQIVWVCLTILSGWCLKGQYQIRTFFKHIV